MTNPFIRSISPRIVMITREGVALFNARWPCSRLRDTRCYWFEFDADGDLIDCNVPEHDDGVEALALCDDCRAWLFDDALPEWLPRQKGAANP